MPSGTYNPSDSTASALRSRVFIRQVPVIPGTAECVAERHQNLALLDDGGGRVVPGDAVVPHDPDVGSRDTETLYGVVDAVGAGQPADACCHGSRDRSGRATVPAVRAAVATGVLLAGVAAVPRLENDCSDSRRDPQASNAANATGSTGANGEFPAIGVNPIAASTPDTTFCAVAGTAFSVEPRPALSGPAPAQHLSSTQRCRWRARGTTTSSASSSATAFSKTLSTTTSAARTGDAWAGVRTGTWADVTSSRLDDFVAPVSVRSVATGVGAGETLPRGPSDPTTSCSSASAGFSAGFLSPSLEVFALLRAPPVLTAHPRRRSAGGWARDRSRRAWRALSVSTSGTALT